METLLFFGSDALTRVIFFLRFFFKTGPEGDTKAIIFFEWNKGCVETFRKQSLRMDQL